MRALVRKLWSPNFYVTSKINIICRYSDDAIITDERLKKKPTDDVQRNIIVEKYENITTINIDRYEKRNSLDIATLKEMTKAVEDFDKDEKAKVLIIHGEGGTFCSGFDVNDMETGGYGSVSDAAVRFTHRPICIKPTIAAVSGYAVGSGFSLALCCDLRIIEDTAVLGVLGRRFGVPMGMKGHARLVSLAGLSRALDLIITGRLISGQEAFQMGLATKVTSTGTALGEAFKLAKSLTKFPQSALMVDKLLAIQSQLGQDNEESVRDDGLILSLLGCAQEELTTQLKKFKQGIGKHGKFYNLTEVPLKDWEIEHTVSEVTVGKKGKFTKKKDKLFHDIKLDCTKTPKS